MLKGGYGCQQLLHAPILCVHELHRHKPRLHRRTCEQQRQHRRWASSLVTKPARCLYARHPARKLPVAHSALSGSKPAGHIQQSPSDSSKPALKIAICAVVAIVSGVFNRVTYRMALQPLGNYVFFLAQFQTFSYVLVYFAFLAWRARSGKVTNEMLTAPSKWRFGLIGACEAIAQVLGFLSASHLPGVVLPLLSQSIMFWQILLNKILRNRVLLRVELAGVLTVVAGVVCAAWPSKGGGVFAQAKPLYITVYLISVFFPAVATVTKSSIFEDAQEKLGLPLDIFVVNSFSSAAQAVCVFLMLPLLSSLRGIPPTQLPEYLAQGWTCMTGGTPSCGSNCAGAPYLAALYVGTNLLFNISLLTLLRAAGNIVLSLTLASVIPLTIWAFTLPLPFLDPAPPIGANFILGTAVLLVGLFTYNSPLWWPALKKRGSPMVTAPE